MADTKINLPEPGILSEFISVLFPIRCVHCGRGGNWLCRECANTMKPVGPTVCPRCGRPESHGYRYSAPLVCPECRGRELHFTRARAAFHFDGPARSLVHRLKYSGQRRLAGFMADVSAAAAAGLTGNGGRVNLTYVPLHSEKLISRGYNQAGLYARAFARRLDLPLKDFLLKNHPTMPQNRLNFDERRKNLTGSFTLRRGARPGGEMVILVDDVYTTGSTASECARILKEGLGVKVYIWTFARTVRRQGRDRQTMKG